MKTSKTIAVITAALLMGISASAQAQTALLTVPTEASGNLRTYASGTSANYSVGYIFTPTSNIIVTSLGWYDANGATSSAPANGSGLVAATTIDLWSGYTTTPGPTGMGTLMATATVPAGNGGTLVGNYLYEALATPIVLTAGTTYGIEGTSNQDWFANLSAPGNGTTASTFVVNLPATVNGYWFNSAYDTNPYSGGGFGATDAFVGPNLLEEATPEPSTLGMLGLGAITMLFVIRRLRSASMV